MILVTIGSSNDFKFTRLLRIIDELCEEKVLKAEEIIAQIGNSDYIPKNYKYFKMVSDEKFKKLINDSKFIISHAGTGCVVSSVKKGKKVIIFPRLFKFNEHLDDHQLEICNFFSSQEYTLAACNKDELIQAIRKIDKFKPKEFISNNSNINDLIINYIEEKEKNK